jgi:hypothetical protein
MSHLIKAILIIFYTAMFLALVAHGKETGRIKTREPSQDTELLRPTQEKEQTMDADLMQTEPYPYLLRNMNVDLPLTDAGEQAHEQTAAETIVMETKSTAAVSNVSENTDDFETSPTSSKIMAAPSNESVGLALEQLSPANATANMSTYEGNDTVSSEAKNTHSPLDAETLN